MRAFIAHTIQDRYYVRVLQWQFEIGFEDDDFQNTTYTYELNQSIFQNDYLGANKEFIRHELMSCDLIVFVNSTPFHRALEYLFRDELLEFFSEEELSAKNLMVLDIDDCIGLDGKELQAQIRQTMTQPRRNLGGGRFPRIFAPRYLSLLLAAGEYVGLMGSEGIREKLFDALTKTHGQLEVAITYVRHQNNIEWTAEQHAFYDEILETFFPPVLHDNQPPNFRRLFLSHSVRDLFLVRPIQIMFYRGGVHAQMFRLANLEDINTREDIIRLFTVLSDEVETERTHAVVMCDSQSFRQSAWTLLELAIAVHHNKPIFRIDIDELWDISDGEERFQRLADYIVHFVKYESTYFLALYTPEIHSLLLYEDLWMVAEVVRILGIQDAANQPDLERQRYAFLDSMAYTDGALMNAVNFLKDNGRLSDILMDRILSF